MEQSIKLIHQEIYEKSKFLDDLRLEIQKVIVGQNRLITRLLIGLLANGHILVEGVPGLAKTLAIKTLADAINLKFSRIQFTPDLLPGDITGTMIFNQRDNTFIPRKGPIFANLVLADEINRAPAKVQSALLEAMQEHQVTIGEKQYKLEDPFLVMATQNPIEQEGTYPLPEAQIDRFMLKVIITYPNKQEEKMIMDRMATENIPKAEPVVESQQILEARTLLHKIYVDERIKNYIIELVFATRFPEQIKELKELKPLIKYGASPRATLYLLLAAKAHAMLQRRGYVTPEDVKEIALDVMRHRIILTYEAEAEERTTDDIIIQILENVEVP